MSDRTKRDIAEAIRRIEPFANIEISCIDIPDTDNSIIALSAEEQRYMRPFSYKGRAYQRIESVTSSMPQEIYNQLLMQRGGKYAWEAIPNSDLKISDPEFHTDGNSVWVVFHRRTVGQHPTATRQLPINFPTATPQVERVLVAIGENTVATKEIMSIMG